MPTGWENSLSIFYLLGAGVLLFLGMLRNYKGAYLLTVFFAVWVFGNGASLLLPNLFGNLYFRFLSNNIASVLFVIQIIFSVVIFFTSISVYRKLYSGKRLLSN